jgi:hypothetical protein
MRTTPWAAALLLLAGCGGTEDRQALTGKVTFRGQPLHQADIEFMSADKGPAERAGAVVVRGSYEVPREKGLPPGRYRVVVSSGNPPVTDREGAPGAAVASGPDAPGAARELIPAKYNTATTLTVEVTAAGPNRFDFNLTDE